MSGSAASRGKRRNKRNDTGVTEARRFPLRAFTHHEQRELRRLMFAYRERRPRASAIAGAAGVQFLTAGNLEFHADLRDERGGRVCDCPGDADAADRADPRFEEQAAPVGNTGTDEFRATLCQLRPGP